MIFVTILRGESPQTAEPVFASADRPLVRSVLQAILKETDAIAPSRAGGRGSVKRHGDG